MSDRQTDKTTRWAFTAYENQWDQFKTIPEIVAEWGWQTEKCPDTGRLHYQGYLRTHRQVRHKQIRDVLPGVHIEVARDWNKLLNYCKKTDTALPDSQIKVVNDNKPLTMAQALLMLAKHHWISFAECDDETVKLYDGKQKKYYTSEYWSCVNKYLEENRNSIGLFTNTQMLTAWINTREFWIKDFEIGKNQLSESPVEEIYMEEDRQTDSQTEISSDQV